MSQFIRLAMVFLLSLTACSPAVAPAPAATQQTGSNAPAEVRADKQVLRIGVSGVVGSVLPLTVNGDHPKYWPMYDRLTQFDASFSVKPGIAEKWELGADRKTWTFTVRKGMTWSNGDPLTAEDVVFTFDLIREKKLSPSSYFGTLDTVKLIDATTFELVTKQVDGTVPAAAQFIWVLPKKYYQSVGDDGFLSKPIGSGPYELVEFKPSDVMRYKARSTPHAFRKVVAEELIFRQIPDNGSVVAGLLAGELDMAAEVSFSADQANRLKQAGMGLMAPLRGIVYVGVPQGSYETRNTPLKDPKVRLALKYAINTDLIANKLLGGFSKQANQMAMPSTPSYITDYKAPAYEPATAKKMLAEAGYPNGFTLAGGLDWTPMFTFQDVALAVQADLKAVGIEFQLTNLEYARFVDKAYGRNNLVLADLTIGRAPDVLGVGVSRTFLGCGKPAGGTPAVLVFCDPQWDKALDDAYAEADPVKRAELLKKATLLYTDSITAIPLYFEPGYIVYTQKTKGVEPQHPIYYNLDSVYLLK